MRQLLRSLRQRGQTARQLATSRPRISLAVVAIAIVLAALGIGAVVAAPRAEPSIAVDDWSLQDLVRHIEADEVATLTLNGAGSTSSHVVAITENGEQIPVALGVPAAETVRAVVGLGHGDLLTPEALAALAPQPAGFDPVRFSLNIGIVAAVLVALVFVMGRARGAFSGGSSTRFSTILPQARPTAPAGPGGADGAADRTPSAGSGVRLDQVAGCEEAKLELTEPIEFLRHPERFRSLGARVPRGVLLFGPPGTGKTMLARAVATEAGVPFLHVSGSEFVEKYVGVGARRVRDLFAQARKLGKAVVFFDEFDALGKSRGGSNSHEEREQTLNQLLVELDGFGTSDEIVVIAATNRLDILDEALLRPGRFNRKVHVGLPDVRGREAILRVHSRNKPLDADVDLGPIARKTYGFSGAQLADLLNEAAISAARRRSDLIGSNDLHAGWLKVAVGTGRRRTMSDRERAIIAAHEVGHAICGRVHGDGRRVEEISLFAHGEALGVTVSSQEDNDLPSESDLRARLVALMGGRAAEEVLFEDVTPGAANDFEKANVIASSMVTRWGMGRDPNGDGVGASGRGVLSLLVARQGGGLPGEVQGAATRAIGHILDTAFAEARATLLAHLDRLRSISAFLLAEERIDGETFDALFDGRINVPEPDADWRPAAARPRQWAAVAAAAAADAAAAVRTARPVRPA